jgi:hypothetical protein
VRFNELDAAGGLRDKAIMRQKRGNAGNLEVDISAGIGDTLKTDLLLVFNSLKIYFFDVRLHIIESQNLNIISAPICSYQIFAAIPKHNMLFNFFYQLDQILDLSFNFI